MNLAAFARTAGCVVALGLASGAVSAASRPSTEPILRVETGMHTTLIRRVVVDAPRNRLVTASDDKTIRIWQMPEARLISTLRVPIDRGHEGQLFGLAISPDGKTVAAGGWTGWDWDGAASIYLFDAAAGDMVKRIGGLDNAVHALAWSPDGRYLAIGLQGRGGVRIVQANDGRGVAADAQYLDKVTDVDFSVQGHLVAVSLDGMVRLYGKDFRLLGRRIVPGGKKPISIRYSPDGELVAVGFVDAPAISILSARDLTLLYQPSTAQLKDQASFMSVTWSSDGNMLYGGGEYKGDGLNPIYRWPAKGRGAPERIPVIRNRITEIQQMPDDRIAFAAEDPGVGVLGPDGKVLVYRGPDIVNFSDARDQLLLSADAGVVSYPSGKGAARHSFNVLGDGDQLLSATPAVQTYAPRLSAPGFQITDWKDHYKPVINGKTPKLDDYEMSRSYAISPDGNTVLLGTEWAVRLFDRNATQLWGVPLPAVAWKVNISQEGRLAVAALSDGTIRWYRMSDGREMLAFFAHGNGKDWIAWTPDGYYASSIYGDNYIGWHVNRGEDLAPDFYRAVQFDRILYRPDIVQGSFVSAKAVATRGIDLLQEPEFSISELNKIAPPRLRVWVQAVEGVDQQRPKAVLRIKAEKNALKMEDYSVFVNSVPVTPNNARKLEGGDAQHFIRTVEVALPSTENEIRVEAFNGVSMGVAETYIGLPKGTRPKRIQGELYVLAIGINAFPNLRAGTYLSYAARDAEKIAKALATRGVGFYRRVHTRVLSDRVPEKPTHDAILSALKFVQRAGAEDTVVVFLASHGLSDKAGNYYFVPRDVTREDIVGVGKGEKVKSLIPWTDFFDALRGAAGRRVLIVDTCHAKRIQGTLDAHSLMKRSAASLFPMIVAAQSKQQSQEYPPARHGLFTYALLDALRPWSDGDHDGAVSLEELFERAYPMVRKLSEKTVGEQDPQLVAPRSLQDMPLMGGTSD
jgi:WD40 repeat protein